MLTATALSTLTNVFNATSLLTGLGGWVLLGVAVVVFIESGVLFPFLPGDSLLVTAAVLRASLGVALWKIVVVAMLAAVAGDQVGYLLGRRYGRRLFKDDARVLRTDRLEAAEDFFDRHGSLALVLGRFVPVVRTYVPLAAGTARMRYQHFVGWNVTGAVTWVGLMTTVGGLLGGIPGIASSIEAIMLLVIAISLLPVAVPAVRRWLAARRVAREAERALIDAEGAARSEAAADGDGRADQTKRELVGSHR